MNNKTPGEKYQEWRNYMLTYLGGKCVVCGTTQNLEVDHIDPKLKTAEFKSMTTYSIRRKQKELNNAQLLCNRHHREKTLSMKDVPQNHSNNNGKHGSGYMYIQKGCRCALCGLWRRSHRAGLVTYADVVDLSIKETLNINGVPERKKEIEHGTRAGYLKEVRKKLTPCDKCKEANAQYSRNFYKKRLS